MNVCIYLIYVLINHSLNGAFQGHWNQMMKQTMQMNVTWLKLPTSCLLTSMTEELNYDLPRNNSS